MRNERMQLRKQVDEYCLSRIRSGKPCNECVGCDRPICISETYFTNKPLAKIRKDYEKLTGNKPITYERIVRTKKNEPKVYRKLGNSELLDCMVGYQNRLKEEAFRVKGLYEKKRYMFEDIGITASYYDKIIMKTAGEPNAETLFKLCKGGFNMAYVLTGESLPHPQWEGGTKEEFSEELFKAVNHLADDKDLNVVDYLQTEGINYYCARNYRDTRVPSAKILAVVLKNKINICKTIAERWDYVLVL